MEERFIKVSVVVPDYNNAHYLRECLDSLVHQTLRDIEIIVVNDGSTDESLSIMREYEKNDSRIVIIDKPNSGYGNTMNVGIKAARGEYIGIVEADDYVLVDMYESLYRKAVENDLDFVKADFYRFYNEDGKYELFYNELTYGKKDYYNRVLTPRDDTATFRFVMNTWSGIYKKSFLEEKNIWHNETPGASFQDNGFWFRTFALADRAMFVNIPYYMNRRDNPNSSIHDKGKVFAVSREYESIGKFLDDNPQLRQKLITTYWLKKYHNYLFTYNRIAEEHKKMFLEHFRNEYLEADRNGELDRTVFNDGEWENVSMIMNDPEAFYEKEKNKGYVLGNINSVDHESDTPVVSVILPVYNVEKYLRQCLDSIFRQTVTNIEIICVDDGSTDGSLKILEEYAAKDDRFIILRQENSGAGAARNKGLDIAKGKYLSFLDSDDFFEPDLLKNAVSQCEKHKADICVYKVDTYHDVKEEFQPADYAFREAYLPDKVAFSYKSMPNHIFSAFQNWAWNKLFRSSFIKENNIRFQEIWRTNDLFFTCTALVKAKCICTYKGILAHYRIGMTTNCQATNDKSPLDFYNAFLALKKELIRINVYKDVECSFVNWSLSGCIYNLDSVRDVNKYEIIYDKLVNGGFAELGITNHSEPYFYFKDRYKAYQKLMNTPMHVCIFEKFVNADKKVKELERLNMMSPEAVCQLEKWKGLYADKCSENQKLTFENEELRKSAQELQKRLESKIISEQCDYLEKHYHEEKRIQNPKISVIIPIYNKDEFLVECLDSITNQTLEDIEIICVNDGSIDDSLPILIDYHKKDSRIVIINQENSGVSAARNNGMKCARGEYIAFADPDDWYPDNDVLETLYRPAKENNADICGGSFSISHFGALTFEFSGDYEGYTFKKQGWIKYSDYQFDYGFHRFLYRRSMLENNNIVFPPYRRFQDPPFFVKAMNTAGQFYAVDKVVYRFRDGHQMIKWDSEKVSGLLMGITDNLRISSENRYAKLHIRTVKRLAEEYSQIITDVICDGHSELMLLLSKACEAIDIELIRTVIPDVNDGYAYEILNALLEKIRNAEPAKPQKSDDNNSESANENKSMTLPAAVYKSNDAEFQRTKAMLKHRSEELKKARNELEQYQFYLDSIRGSFSYRAGLFVTFIPRKLRELLKGKK